MRNYASEAKMLGAKRLSDDELKAIAARANAATPGPWIYKTSLDDPAFYSVAGELEVPAGHVRWDILGDGGGNVEEWGHILLSGGVEPGQIELRSEDLVFITNARADIEALLAEVHRLRHRIG